MNKILKFGLVPILSLVLVACDQPSADKSPGQGTAADHPPQDSSLMGWWKFDEGNGSTAADASGHGNTANLRNAGWGSGKVAGALQMNGGNDSIVIIPLSDSLRTATQGITVMGWAYRTAQHNVDLVGHGYPDLFLGFHGAQFKWLVMNENNKQARCYAEPKYQASLNQWFHLAGTYNGRTARLYVNGVEICSTWLWRGGPIKMSNQPFSISGYLDTKGNIVDEITGKIDDVRIYNRALSATEVQAVFYADK